jgi:hypothetical protein
MTAAVWVVLGVLTLVLIVMTFQYLTHDPAVCRVCVDRAAQRRRHPTYRGPEDDPHWGHR